MRRKHIVLIDRDETRRGILAYALQVHRYAVHQCGSVREAQKLLLEEMELILGYWPLPIKEFQKLYAVGTPCAAVLSSSADVFPRELRYIYATTMEDLLNQIKVLSTKKRGSKRGWKCNQLTAA